MKPYLLLACCIFNLSLLAQWNSKKISEIPEEEQPLSFTAKKQSGTLLTSPSANLDFVPNRSNGIVTLHLGNVLPQTKICVYDATGKCVLEETTTKKARHDIDLTSQSKGIYVMEITSGEEKAVTKIMLE
ncbi:MAG: Secretion system C-terminal sorting domain [Bacteroidota bacterium]|jgi:hypothetical protein|nr:Secretion system C-terminal sorting domain [Bacteroidota bacterium]